MKYSFGRKIQLDKYLGDEFKYTSADFMVIEADSFEEAEEAVDAEIKRWVSLQQTKKTELPFKGDEYKLQDVHGKLIK